MGWPKSHTHTEGHSDTCFQFLPFFIGQLASLLAVFAAKAEIARISVYELLLIGGSERRFGSNL